MDKSVKAIPDGYHTITPNITVGDAAGALDFYQKALGAEEVMRLEGPGGTIGHAEIKIGDSMIMLADECPEMSFRGPKSIGGTPVSLHVYVEKVDARFELAQVAALKHAIGMRRLRPDAFAVALPESSNAWP